MVSSSLSLGLPRSRLIWDVEGGRYFLVTNREREGDYRSIPADHEHITKFSGVSDIGIRRVSAPLIRWTKDIKEQRKGVVLEET